MGLLRSQLGRGLAACRGALSTAVASVAAVVDPSEHALTALWRDWTSPTWTGGASAGTSSANDLTDPGNEPDQGTELNGYGTANYNGTNDYLLADGTFDTYSAAKAFTFWFLVKPDSVTNSGVLLYTGGGANDVNIAFNGSSQVDYRPRGPLAAGAIATVAAGSYCLIIGRYNGTLAQIGVNQIPGTEVGSSVSQTNNQTLTGAVRIGGSGAVGLDGHLAECGLADFVFTDQQCTDLIDYVNSQYGLSL